MTTGKQEIGDVLGNFKAKGGRLGGKRSDAEAQQGNTTASQVHRKPARQIDITTASPQNSETDKQQDSNTEMQKPAIDRMKTGYSLDRNLIKRAKHLATDEGCDVNALIEEGLRLVFEKRGLTD